MSCSAKSGIIKPFLEVVNHTTGETLWSISSINPAKPAELVIQQPGIYSFSSEVYTFIRGFITVEVGSSGEHGFEMQA